MHNFHTTLWHINKGDEGSLEFQYSELNSWIPNKNGRPFHTKRPLINRYYGFGHSRFLYCRSFFLDCNNKGYKGSRDDNYTPLPFPRSRPIRLLYLYKKGEYVCVLRKHKIEVFRVNLYKSFFYFAAIYHFIHSLPR